MPRLALRSSISALGLCSLLALLGCPLDKEADEGASGSSSSSSTSGSGPTTTPPAESSSGSGVDGDSDGTGGSSSGGGSSSSSGDDGETGSSGGMEVCQVELPPPPACPAMDAPPPVIIEGDWPSPRPSVDDDLVADDEPEHGGAFIVEPDLPMQFECSTFEQDCPAGDKCMPWDNSGGGAWNATRCSPVAAMPGQLGDSCTVEGAGTSGVDDCDVGLMCWDVDAESGQGTCIELCSCSPENPVCNAANTTCAISNEGALAICLPVCNPLDPGACATGQACYPIGDTFLCAPDASGDLGLAGDPCEYVNVCDPGLLCLGADAVPGCAGLGCCSPACSPGDDGPCLPGQTCEPWFEPGMAPDECLGMVGVCTAPV